jgi:hypothetical protein
MVSNSLNITLGDATPFTQQRGARMDFVAEQEEYDTPMQESASKDSIAAKSFCRCLNEYCCHSERFMRSPPGTYSSFNQPRRGRHVAIPRPGGLIGVAIHAWPLDRCGRPSREV